MKTTRLTAVAVCAVAAFRAGGALADTVYDTDLTVSRFVVASNANENAVQSAGTITVNGGGEEPFVAGWDANIIGRYTMTSGMLDITAGSPKIGYKGIGLVDVQNGELRFESGYPAIGNALSGKGSIVARGDGLVNASAGSALVVGQQGFGMLSAIDGGRVRSSVAVRPGWDASGTGQVNVVRSGTLEAVSVSGRYGTAYVNFAGGMVKPLSAGTVSDYMSGLDPALHAGGVVFDTDGKAVSLAAVCKDGRLKSSNLVHRWSFNGDLKDSAGNKDATLPTSTGVTQGEKEITLPGGTTRATYISLGSGVVPETTDGVTFELWATHLSIQSWSRIFTACNAEKNTYMFMTWDRETDLAQDICRVAYNWNYSSSSSNNKLAPWELGREFHISVVCKKSGDVWNVTFYKQDVATGMTLKKTTVTAPSGFSPDILNDQFNLGWSSSGADLDANAKYNEMRIWSIPLTEEELALSGIMGPDADLSADASFVKTGAGTLAISAAQTYSGPTEVREGALALGTPETPTHRWSFTDGSLVDSVSGTPAAKFGSDTSGIVATNDNKAIYLPGGARGTAYLNLGSGTLPSGGFTIEIWATLEKALSAWTRIFTLYADGSEYAFMSWQGDAEDKDIVGLRTGGENYNVGRTMSPWECAKPYHIVYVCSPDGSGGWKFDFYKQNATTGELEKKGSGTAPAGWSPSNLASASFNLGWSKGDPDACASYDEVRIWNRAFTEEEVVESGLRGADRLPIFGNVAASPGSLSSSTVLKVGPAADFAICGASQTVAAVEGNGTIDGPGTLTATGAVRPGGASAAGTITLAGGVTLVGDVEFDIFGDGTCDCLHFADGSTYDVSGIRLTLASGATIDPERGYEIADIGEATLSGYFDCSAIPGKYRVMSKDGKLILSCKRGLTLIVF